MNSFHCPYCNSDIPVINSTHATYTPSFEDSTGSPYGGFGVGDFYSSAITIEFFKCPKCSNYSIFAKECGSYTKGLYVPLIPNSHAKQFPKYIPKPILQDYKEAYSILNLSPKASATLSRRCLQGMIRDFWNISKNRLIDEISELQDKVPPSQWRAIDALRKIGNIGAHMKADINTIVDVDPDEAQKLLNLIELLIDKWYISRHDEEELLKDITQIADVKNKDKSSNH